MKNFEGIINDLIEGMREAFSIGDMERSIEQKHRSKIKNLQARAKPLHKLVVSCDFIVEGVISENYETSVSPHSEQVIGGKSSKYDSGYTVGTSLDVLPSQEGVPVRKLLFEGYSSVRAGDKICARMSCFNEKHISDTCNGEPSRTYYFPRALQKTENVIEIEIIQDGKIVRVERSTLYEEFQKQKG